MNKRIVFGLMVISLSPWICLAQRADERKRGEDGHRSGIERPENEFRSGKRGAFMRGDWLERFREENPEEYETLMELKEKDPDKFRSEMRERMKSRVAGFMRQRGSEQDKEARELSQRFHAAENEEEKAALKSELTEKVYEAFDARLEGQKKLIAHLEEQINKLKKQVQARAENREAICRKRIDSLTEDPKLKW